MNRLGQLLASALLGLEEAGLGLANPDTAPEDIAAFVTGIFQIWNIHPAGKALVTKPATAAAK